MENTAGNSQVKITYHKLKVIAFNTNFVKIYTISDNNNTIEVIKSMKTNSLII